MGASGLASAAEVDEDEALPQLDRQRRKWVVLLVERLGALHRRRSEQAAGEVVAPLVVGTGELRAVPGVVGHLHAAVLTDGRERADAAVLRPGDDDRLAADGGGEVVADVRNAAGAADALPLGGEHRVALERQELLRRVDLGRHRDRLRHVGDARVEGGEQLLGQDGHAGTCFLSVGPSVGTSPYPPPPGRSRRT